MTCARCHALPDETPPARWMELRRPRSQQRVPRRSHRPPAAGASAAGGPAASLDLSPPPAGDFAKAPATGGKTSCRNAKHCDSRSSRQHAHASRSANSPQSADRELAGDGRGTDNPGRSARNSSRATRWPELKTVGQHRRARILFHGALLARTTVSAKGAAVEKVQTQRRRFGRRRIVPLVGINPPSLRPLTTARPILIWVLHSSDMDR
jgi:hypothetical protein